MNWMQVLTREQVVIEAPEPAVKEKAKRKRIRKVMPTSIYVPLELKDKFKALGGSKWVAQKLREA